MYSWTVVPSPEENFKDVCEAVYKVKVEVSLPVDDPVADLVQVLDESVQVLQVVLDVVELKPQLLDIVEGATVEEKKEYVQDAFINMYIIDD